MKQIFIFLVWFNALGEQLTLFSQPKGLNIIRVECSVRLMRQCNDLVMETRFFLKTWRDGADQLDLTAWMKFFYRLHLIKNLFSS